MKTLEITPEIKIEIENSIKEFKALIRRESLISADLRYNDKIELWNNKVIELENALINGVI